MRAGLPRPGEAEKYPGGKIRADFAPFAGRAEDVTSDPTEHGGRFSAQPCERQQRSGKRRDGGNAEKEKRQDREGGPSEIAFGDSSHHEMAGPALTGVMGAMRKKEDGIPGADGRGQQRKDSGRSVPEKEGRPRTFQ